MPGESQASTLINSKFSQSNISTLVIMDEPDENTTIYAWRDERLKKLPYDEHVAQTGQKIKTFYTFSKEEKVIIVNVDKRQMTMTIGNGLILNGEMKAGKPDRYFVNSDESLGKEFIHHVPIDNPVLFFSLNFKDFGEEIRGTVVRDPLTNRLVNEYKFPYGQYACAGIYKKDDR